MSQNQIEVHFIGICTHFIQPMIYPPLHRVVLVHAEDGGFINEAKIPPHPALLRMDPDSIVRIDGYPYGIQQTRQDGVWRILGVTLTLEGIKPIPLEIDSSFSEVPSLTQLTPDAPPVSDQVVLGERASCYFNLQYGSLGAVKNEYGAIHSVLTAEVLGVPALRVTCFWNLESSLITLEPGTRIYIEQTGVTSGDSEKDFLLHYRILESIPPNAGIPTGEKKRPEGLPGDIGAGCSNSQYP